MPKKKKIRIHTNFLQGGSGIRFESPERFDPEDDDVPKNSVLFIGGSDFFGGYLGKGQVKRLKRALDSLDLK